MPDTTTPNYSWIKPAIGGDAAVWGATLNNDLDAIDAQVFANNGAWPVVLSGALNAVPIGAILAWGSETLFPDNYVGCDGSIYNVADMPHLFSVIQNTFGGDGVATFGVPNLESTVMIGFGSGVDIGETHHAGANAGTDFMYLAMGFIIRFE